MSTAWSEAPRSVNHWLPAASTVSSAPVSVQLPAQPLARPLPGLRPRDSLSAVVVPGQLLELAKLIDGPAGLQRHAATLTW